MTVAPVRALAVVIPAWDEAGTIAQCLASVRLALTQPGVRSLRQVVVLALDTRDADTQPAAEPWLRPGRDVVLRAGCDGVGAARRAGVRAALAALGRSVPPAQTWLAMTDADSVVAPTWLSRHLALANEGWDAVAGNVAIADWSEHPPHVVRAYEALLEGRRVGSDRHTHVYGANLGVRASSYLAVGGFAALQAGEDRALWEALVVGGHRIVHPLEVTVRTSGRRQGRAAGGLSALLRRLADEPDATSAG